MVNLPCLSPDIVAAILEDELPNHITLFELAVDPTVLWGKQVLNLKWAINKFSNRSQRSMLDKHR